MLLAVRPGHPVVVHGALLHALSSLQSPLSVSLYLSVYLDLTNALRAETIWRKETSPYGGALGSVGIRERHMWVRL